MNNFEFLSKRVDPLAEYSQRLASFYGHLAEPNCANSDFTQVQARMGRAVAHSIHRILVRIANPDAQVWLDPRCIVRRLLERDPQYHHLLTFNKNARSPIIAKDDYAAVVDFVERVLVDITPPNFKF